MPGGDTPLPLLHPSKQWKEALQRAMKEFYFFPAIETFLAKTYDSLLPDALRPAFQITLEDTL